MSESPDFYLRTPDPLSTLLSSLELTAQVFANGDYCGAWAVDTSGTKKIPFHIIGSGAAWLHFQDNPPRELSSGDIVIFPNDDSHLMASSSKRPTTDNINAGSHSSSDDAKPITQMICGYFEFRSPNIFPLLDALPSAVVLESKDNNSGELIKVLVNFMLKELSRARPGHYSAIDQMAFLLFIEVLRQQVDSQTISSGLIAALFDARLGQVLNAIHQQPEHPWTLDMLADIATMSRSNFALYFRKILGLTPMKYMTLWRMNEARKLLKTTSFSVAQIAESCF
jgi:AraC family transcriptional activator of mtrCDE